MIEQGKHCNYVVVQLLARGCSVPRAANRIVTEACQSAPPPGDFDLLTPIDLVRLPSPIA